MVVPKLSLRYTVIIYYRVGPNHRGFEPAVAPLLVSGVTSERKALFVGK